MEGQCAFGLEYDKRETGGCQFGELAGDLIEYDKQKWCQFHLPQEAKKKWSKSDIYEFNKEVFDWIEESKKKSKKADFTGVVFPGKISFWESSRDFPDVSFVETTFMGFANFFETLFRENADFSGITFIKGVRFEKSTFRKLVQFRGAEFHQRTNFRSAKFINRVIFYKSNFFKVSNFSDALFDEGVDFQHNGFGGNAIFKGAQFRGEADFRDARFLKEANFRGESKEGADTLPQARFGLAEFAGPTHFDNRKFTGAASFKETKFLGTAPTFHRCTLHQDTDFTGAVFADRSGDAAPAYRTLKLAMEDMRARDEEAMFHALELECRRKRSDTPATAKVFSYLYDWGSNYGLSLAHPVFWLAAFNFLFWMFYMTISVDMDARDGVGALSFALEQLVRPFFIWSSEYSRTVGGWVGKALSVMPLGLRVLATAQSLISFGLIALLGLAMRRRFRMG